MSIVMTLAAIEEDDSLHLARLLILLAAFGGRGGAGRVSGLTKLAKLDFLLRYPTYFERALVAKHANPGLVGVHDYERRSVESAMVRYRYGPWDHRYRRFLNILIGKGLVVVELNGRSSKIGLTPQGQTLTSQFASLPEFGEFQKRARLLKQHFDIGGTTLKDFIYATFPEIVSMKMGETISP